VDTITLISDDSRNIGDLSRIYLDASRKLCESYLARIICKVSNSI